MGDRDNWRRCEPVALTGYPISSRIPEPGTFSKRFPSSRSTYVPNEDVVSSSPSSEESGSYSVVAMGMGLTNVGIVWTTLSLLATCVCCVGYVFPYWLTGSMLEQPVYFGVFRRCNYPTTAEGGMFIGCGRYASFGDIPTLSWRLCTVLVGVGCIGAMLVAFTGVLACCVRDLVTRRVGQVAGFIQLVAACLVASGCILYPNGWDHAQVQAACGEQSSAYKLGDCSLAWAYYATVVGCGLLFLASLLSCRAGRRKSESYGI